MSLANLGLGDDWPVTFAALCNGRVLDLSGASSGECGPKASGQTVQEGHRHHVKEDDEGDFIEGEDPDPLFQLKPYPASANYAQDRGIPEVAFEVVQALACLYTGNISVRVQKVNHSNTRGLVSSLFFSRSESNSEEASGCNYVTDIQLPSRHRRRTVRTELHARSDKR